MKPKLRLFDLIVVSTFLLIIASAIFGQELPDSSAPKDDAVAKYFPKPSLKKPLIRSLPAASPTGSDEWQYQITPYAWIPQLEGNLRVRETIVRVDASASSLVGMLDFVAAVHFEATKRKYGFFLDENYVNLGTEGVRPISGNVTRVEPTMNIFEAGATYAPIIIHDDNGTSSEPLPPKFSLEILGGLRVFYMGIGIDPTNLSAVEGSRTIVDAFAGNRVNFRPIPRLTFSGKYTLGGGGSHFSWSGNLMADYRFRRNLSFNGGYQVLDINADKGSNTVGFNGRLRGMLFGLTLYR